MNISKNSIMNTFKNKRVKILIISIICLIIIMISIKEYRYYSLKSKIKADVISVLKTNSNFNSMVKGNSDINIDGSNYEKLVLSGDDFFDKQPKYIKYRMFFSVFDGFKQGVNKNLNVGENFLNYANIDLVTKSGKYNFNINGLTFPDGNCITLSEYEDYLNRCNTIVKVTSLRIEDGYDYVTGFIINKSSSPISYYEIRIEFLDNAGNVLNSDFTNGNTIVSPNTQQRFEVMTDHVNGVVKCRPVFQKVDYGNN